MEMLCHNSLCFIVIVVCTVNCQLMLEISTGFNCFSFPGFTKLVHFLILLMKRVHKLMLSVFSNLTPVNFCFRLNSSCPVPVEGSLPLLAEPKDISSEDAAALVLGFTRAGCCSSRLVGGKGCQLGLLTQLQSEVYDAKLSE